MDIPRSWKRMKLFIEDEFRYHNLVLFYLNKTILEMYSKMFASIIFCKIGKKRRRRFALVNSSSMRGKDFMDVKQLVGILKWRYCSRSIRNNETSSIGGFRILSGERTREKTKNLELFLAS